MVVEAAPRVSDLVPLTKVIVCDDTLNEFRQVLRLDIVAGKPLRTQLLLDRRHKWQPKLSKPLGYFRMSNTDQLVRLASNALSAALVLNMQSNLDRPFDQVQFAVESMLDLIRADIATTVDTVLRDLRAHKLAQQSIADALKVT